MITTSISIFLVKNFNLFFILLVLSFFHVRVHGQCPATAKYNLKRILKTVYIKLLQSILLA